MGRTTGVITLQILIRPEQPGDRESIRSLVTEVFEERFGEGAEVSGLTDRLRTVPGFSPELSLVAACGDDIIGSIMFSPVVLEQAGEIPAAVLAPLGVASNHQRQGTGSALVREGLEVCRQHGYRIVFVTGSRSYYSRFRFVSTSSVGLSLPFEDPTHDMVLELVPGALSQVKGQVLFPRQAWQPWLAESDDE
jgi:putative acetyltransferase